MSELADTCEATIDNKMVESVAVENNVSTAEPQETTNQNS